jgi:hypothetical protein
MNKDNKVQNKFIAIKVQGINHWIWFALSNVTKENNRFIGKSGWGKGGAFTEIEVSENKIEGVIHSDELQY